MVVRIKSPHSLQRALNYNEKKCQKDQAQCIHAENYLLPADKMNFHQKLERLQDLILRNERAKKSNTLHISLNFDPSERFKTEKLNQIARTYMDKIGFGDQPYLVYEHHDAGHPHIHILTTNIQADGRRIDTYNIGRNQSEKARKEIETKFGLIKAQDKRQSQALSINAVDVQKVQYGKSETLRSISNVLDKVLDRFKYTSLAELNAVLKLYNVMADRGREAGITFRTGGLHFRLLDEHGKKIGVPAKASLIHSKPILKNLERRFTENQSLRQPDKRKLVTSIDWVLSKGPKNLPEFLSALQKEKVQVLLRENKDGIIYGITFIDFRTKAVFNGSDLGKSYSIAGIKGKLINQPDTPVQKEPDQSKETIKQHSSIDSVHTKQEIEKSSSNNDLLKDLMDHEKNINRVAGELLKKKRKKQNKTL